MQTGPGTLLNCFVLFCFQVLHARVVDMFIWGWEHLPNHENHTAAISCSLYMPWLNSVQMNPWTETVIHGQNRSYCHQNIERNLEVYLTSSLSVYWMCDSLSYPSGQKFVPLDLSKISWSKNSYFLSSLMTVDHFSVFWVQIGLPLSSLLLLQITVSMDCKTSVKTAFQL